MLPLSSSFLSLARPHHTRAEYLGNLMTKGTGSGADGCSQSQPSRSQNTHTLADARAPHSPAGCSRRGCFSSFPLVRDQQEVGAYRRASTLNTAVTRPDLRHMPGERSVGSVGAHGNLDPKKH